MQKITENIYYVGVNDRNKSLFEGLWPLPNGVSYNSYLIDDEKVCLIDTVEVDFFTQFLEHIHEVIGERPIDYMVINHMEPDHSGSIALIKKYYPEIQINGGDVTISMGQGDTDALDSNGGLTITGGTINITAQSPFDYDGTGTLSGGTVIVNGQEVTQLSNQLWSLHSITLPVALS